MAGRKGAPIGTVHGVAMAQDLCMTLLEVEQRLGSASREREAIRMLSYLLVYR
jgi:hypothetical protein